MRSQAGVVAAVEQLAGHETAAGNQELIRGKELHGLVSLSGLSN